eukprot:3598021-Pyramimonas_sp.AAC.1
MRIPGVARGPLGAPMPHTDTWQWRMHVRSHVGAARKGLGGAMEMQCSQDEPHLPTGLARPRLHVIALRTECRGAPTTLRRVATPASPLGGGR